MTFKIKNKKPKEKSSFSVKRKKYDVAGNIRAYETGKLDDEQTIRLFQHLEKTGQAYKLKSHYGRQTRRFIGAGLIKPNLKIHSKKEIKRYEKRYERREKGEVKETLQRSMFRWD